MNSHSSGHAVGPDAVAIAPNGVQTPDLIANGDVHPQKSGPSASPSPATPTSTLAAPDVKIDMDFQEQESDVRHEPMPIKSIELIQKPAVIPTISHSEPPTDSSPTPTNPQGSASPPPADQHTEDVKMDDATAPNGNGAAHDDVVMDYADTETSPASEHVPPDASMASIPPTSTSPCPQHDEDVRPPPAKRARMHSDADQASLAHSATPPPASAQPSSTSTPAPSSSPTSTLTAAQYKFCFSTIRSLKKLKDAGPFLKPVDYVALNVPHYPSIIKTPMDFSTVDRKLTSSNPGKLDTNTTNPRYYSVDEFISDVRLIFQNCITFNGPDHAITLMGKRVEQVFDKQIKQMPAAEVKPPPVVKKVPTPPPPPPPVAVVAAPVPLPKKAPAAARRMSASVPVIRRSDTEAVGRPKREIHPPPPKDLAYADAPKKHRKHKVAKDDGTNEQLKFCGKVLADLHRKQHYAIASPFYEPVDWVKLDLPSYPKMIKRPMDLLTMRKKLESGQYASAQKFFDDFKLMIRNCFTFNPSGTPVNLAGIDLQRLFDDKWKQLPPLRDMVSEDDEEEEEEDSEAERQRAIAEMENQIETMRGNIAMLKTKKKKEKEKKEKREKVPAASTSKSAVKPAKAPSKKKKVKPALDNDVLTFEQKKDLSESIAKLDEAKLEKVIQIIHEGVPEIRDSTEEIELEIDLLPAPVLTKLYNFVIRPMRPPPAKRNRQGKGTGTGGLKRKSMDEDVEAEKIRLLEERMALFDRKSNGGTAAPARQDSDHSSDSSDGSDSSGSDSE